MLDLIQKELEANGVLVPLAWQSLMDDWGKRVARYREYMDGDHRAELSTEMAQMLRISKDSSEAFNANYCELVVNAMVDRLKVTRIRGDSEAASVWAKEILDYNRFDGLQLDVHEATARDGDTFLLLEPIAGSSDIRMAHEPAWDGETGMMVVYDRTNKTIIAAVKVWTEASDSYVRFYFPGRTLKYRYDVTTDSDSLTGKVETTEVLTPMDEAENDGWETDAGDPLPVPVVHFRNRSKTRQTTGSSEIRSAVPLQDALNRTVVSMIMTAELAGFGLRKAKGFLPPADLAPGKWVYFGDQEDDAAKLAAMDADLIKQAELGPFLNQGDWLINQISTITRTPLPLTMGGDSQSGEALKQRETGLLGKVGRFQVKIGNAWEDVLALANEILQTFATVKPAASLMWATEWQNAQVRNEADIRAEADQLQRWGFEREALRKLGYEDEQIDNLIKERQNDRVAAMDAVFRNQPNFNNLQVNNPNQTAA